MKVVYWSSTGNTEKMAEMLAEEIKNAGGSAEVSEVSTVSPTDLEGETVFALGASAMGDEELDEGEMEPVCRGSGEIRGRQKSGAVRFL